MARLEAVHPVLMSRNIQSSIEFFGRLGFRVTFQDSTVEPRYVALRRDAVELHLQWHDAADWQYPVDRPTYRFLVEDVHALHQELSEQGALSDATPVMETPWGTREFHVRDPDLNGLQFYWGL
jgi:hypothetical protein